MTQDLRVGAGEGGAAMPCQCSDFIGLTDHSERKGCRLKGERKPQNPRREEDKV